MKIKMIAIAPYDGWAFILKDEQLYLLRPPYRSGDLIEASEKDAAEAIFKHGFRECDYEFNNFPETIHFLKEKYVENMKEQSFSLSGEGDIKSLLEYASDEILAEYLEKVEKEFIPQGKLDAGESLLIELLRLDKVSKNDTMRNKILDLIEKCKEERDRLKSLTFETSGTVHEFPKAEAKYSEFAILEYKQRIYKDKQFFRVGM